ncbi:hypothetical protein [Daejeonella oryzae]|uniref:hypothetical protein n=1 Tax=Daejeonella oryzae TaxID=1122943 RepID=UPI0012DD85EA|nr:hypothetical protein [Daejeonella oryzae]
MVLIISACRKEEIITRNSSAKLSFSSDTILFDTVFTSIGSTTRRLKVYNPNKNAIRISSIKLSGGASSPYQININGQATNQLNDLEISGKDSINIFIKVSINPGSAMLPFIVSDSLLFSTNGNHQVVQLAAYGQNANFLDAQTISQNSTWDDSLPYVIYNSALVEKDITLNITKGARIYFHKDSKLFIAGTLKVKGSVGDSVTFSSDRTEQIYRDEPGQWGGLHFLKSSKSNSIEFTSIKNALTGIRVDSLSENNEPKLILANSILKNMEVSGLMLYNADIKAFNNLIYNCGQYLIYAVLGGNYDFKQNTLAGLNFNFPRQSPAVYFSDNYQTESSSQSAELKIELVNNIVWGSLDNELQIDKKNTLPLNIRLQNNLIKSNNASFTENGNLLNTDPQFEDPRKENYHLKVLSPAINKGISLTGDPYFHSYLFQDLSAISRTFPSEQGCYEIK